MGESEKQGFSTVVQPVSAGRFSGIAGDFQRRIDSGAGVGRASGIQRTHRKALDRPSGKQCAVLLSGLAAAVGVQPVVWIRGRERRRAAVAGPVLRY